MSRAGSDPVSGADPEAVSTAPAAAEAALWPRILGAAALFAVLLPWALRPWFLAPDLLPLDDGPFAAMENTDLYLNAWILAWVARALLVDPLALFDGNVFYPAQNTLALSENMLQHAIVTVPTLAWTGSALAVLKAMALESFTLAGVGMFAWVYHHTRSVPAALFAGAAFAFAPWRVKSFPHPQYLATAFMPLGFLAVDLWWERSRRTSLVGLAACVTAQILACLYLAYFLLLGLGAYLLVRVGGAPAEWRRAIGPVAAIGVGGLLGAPVGIPYALARSGGIIPAFDMAGFRGHTWAPWDYLSGEFLALGGATAIVIVGLEVLRRVLARLRGEAEPLDAIERGAWGVVGIGILLSTGPYLELPGGDEIPTPYLILYHLVPGFSAIRGPKRLFILVLAGVCALAGVAVARWLRRAPAPAQWGVAALLVAACVVLAAPRPAPVEAARVGAHTPEIYTWLAGREGEGAVLEMPAAAIDSDFVGNLRDARYMLASTTHWRPLLNGFSGYEPPTYHFFAPAMRRLPEAEALRFLVDSVNVRWIVLHRDELRGHEVEQWSRPLPPGLRSVARFGADEVLAVELEPSASHWRDRLRETPGDESLSGISTAPLSEACRRARIADVKLPPVVALTAFPVEIPVTIENRGDCPWPAVGIRERGLVGLSYEWVDPAGRRAPRGAFTRLFSDVAPGATVEDRVVVIPPFGLPGQWSLDVIVEQRGVAELARQTVTATVQAMGGGG